MISRYFIPVEIFFGRGLLTKLGNFFLVENAKKVLLVVGEHFKKNTDKVIFQIKEKSLVYQPKILKSDLATIDQLTLFCRVKKPDLIIAIGGGTILDTAKSAAILATHEGFVKNYVVGEKIIDKSSIPLIAIPTTAGTGSEVTPWAVVWDTESKKKYSLSSPLMFPKLALVDSRLTEGLPVEITASTGMDALTQAIEAYWSKNHNSISDVFALQAVRMILANIEKAVNNPDAKAREGMMLGSLLSGLAFSNTQTTICHAVSYPITLHWGVSHGQAVAITLPEFIKFSLSALGKRKAVLLRSLGVADKVKAAFKITKLMKNIGLVTTLSQLMIKEKDFAIIIKEGFHPDRVGNAPRVPTAEELYKILKNIL